MIFAWLLKTAVGRMVGLVLGSFLLSGILYAGCQVKGCIEHDAKVDKKVAERTLEIDRADDKFKEKIKEMTHEELLDFARTGILPERLRKKH